MTVQDSILSKSNNNNTITKAPFQVEGLINNINSSNSSNNVIIVLEVTHINNSMKNNRKDKVHNKGSKAGTHITERAMGKSIIHIQARIKGKTLLTISLRNNKNCSDRRSERKKRE